MWNVTVHYRPIRVHGLGTEPVQREPDTFEIADKGLADRFFDICAKSIAVVKATIEPAQTPGFHPG